MGVHVIFRRKSLYGALRKHLGEVFHRLAGQKESRIEEGHLLPDHVHMLIAIPPKYAVAQVIGYIKGKSAIHLARVYAERKQNFVGQHFWARGYFVSTVALPGDIYFADKRHERSIVGLRLDGRAIAAGRWKSHYLGREGPLLAMAELARGEQIKAMDLSTCAECAEIGAIGV
jgi:putative transposase